MATTPIVLFPLISRTGDIRHVAARLLEHGLPREMAQYQRRVTANLRRQVEAIGADAHELEEQMPLFWSEVMRETGRLIEAQFSQGESA